MRAVAARRSRPAEHGTTARHRVVTIADLGAEDLAAWQDLADRALDPHPYFDPVLLGGAARLLGGGRGVRAVVVERDGRWVALLPFERVPRDHRWPLPHASLDGPVIERYAALRTPLLDAGAPRDAARDLVAALHACRRALGHVVDLPLQRADGPAEHVLREALARAHVPVRVWDVVERGALRPPAPAEPLAGVSRSRRRGLERRRRRLAALLGAEPVAVDAADDPGVVETFLDLEAAGWKGDPARGGEARRVVPGAAAWFGDALRHYLARGEAVLPRLGPAGSPAYLAVRVRRGATVYALSDAYDPALADGSPGAWGRLLGMRLVLTPGEGDAAGRDAAVTMLDSCTDPRRYPGETTLYPDRTTVVGWSCAVGAWPSRALLRGLVAAGRARRALERARARARALVGSRTRPPAAAEEGRGPVSP